VRVIVTTDYDEMSKEAAEIIADRITSFRPTKRKPYFVLGLATGRTPIGTYQELVRLHKAGKLDFSRVATFNLDEYLLLSPDHPQSYHYFMYENLFNHINIKKRNINIPNGLARDFKKFCQDYEKKIKRLGGIDLQVLGIGGDGHIAFNEPGSSLASRTRVKTLNPQTIRDNYKLFFKEDNFEMSDVPIFALTMGVGTIMEAKEVVLLASGEGKAKVVAKAIEGPVTSEITASKLQDHADATVILDEGAASKLKRRAYYNQVLRGEREFSKIQDSLKKGGSIEKARELQKKFLEKMMREWEL